MVILYTLIKLFENKKGDVISDQVYLWFSIFLVVVSLVIFYLTGNSNKNSDSEQILVIKEGYQSIQLARTFLESPMEFDGQTKTVEKWVNDYYFEKDRLRKIQLGEELLFFGSKILDPQLKGKKYDTTAAFLFYVNDELKDELEVGYSQGNSDNEKGIIVTAKDQSNVELRIPLYSDTLEMNPLEDYILFKISNRYGEVLNYE